MGADGAGRGGGVGPAAGLAGRLGEEDAGDEARVEVRRRERRLEDGPWIVPTTETLGYSTWRTPRSSLFRSITMDCPACISIQLARSDPRPPLYWFMPDSQPESSSR